MKTIVALSTPQLTSAIHIIRVSGDNAFSVVNKICKQKIIKKGFSIQKADLYDEDQKIDEVLLNKFVAPKSYTGEDLVEINCHGSLYLANKIIECLIKNGCVLAKRGEFTKRAFLNNKISLIQSEAINNLINSTNDLAIKISINGLDNKTSTTLKRIRDDVFKILGQTEVNIDYPEYENVPDVSPKQIKKIFCTSLKTLRQILETSNKFVKIKDGINVAIVGKPNVGKSSLLNAILNEDKAIVSSIPGTTRDIVESSCVINGIKFNFLDTAGIRKPKDKIEKIGIKKTNKTINEADLIFVVIDNSTKLSPEDNNIIRAVKNKNHQIILNKSDKKPINNMAGIQTSAKKGQISALINFLSNYKNINKLNLKKDFVLQTNESITQIECVYKNLLDAQNIFTKNKNTELLCNHLQNAIQSLDGLLGTGSDISLIDELFDKFCIGK